MTVKNNINTLKKSRTPTHNFCALWEVSWLNGNDCVWWFPVSFYYFGCWLFKKQLLKLQHSFKAHLMCLWRPCNPSSCRTACVWKSTLCDFDLWLAAVVLRKEAAGKSSRHDFGPSCHPLSWLLVVVSSPQQHSRTSRCSCANFHVCLSESRSYLCINQHPATLRPAITAKKKLHQKLVCYF